MNVLVAPVLMVLASATAPAARENTLLTELVDKGVAMPDGQVVPLPAPDMAEGLTAQQQIAVLTALAPKHNLEEFLKNDSGAPVRLKLGKIASKTEDDVIRTVNIGFVVFGDWEVLTSDDFSQSILKARKAKNDKAQETVSKAGYLKTPELAVRGLTSRSTPNLKEYFLYTTFNLFGRVEVSATRFCLATKTPDGVIVAAKVDPRFAKDKQFPNRWRPIVINALGNPELGMPHAYSGSAFFAKVTRLVKPQNAIFVEFHQVFYEPRVWFGEDDNLMPAKLRQIVPFEVKQFRIKLLRATEKKTETQDKP